MLNQFFAIFLVNIFSILHTVIDVNNKAIKQASDNATPSTAGIHLREKIFIT
ncbi:hypothetical protein A359_06720 [secondary endosymbiont of Ctenarytaina eucalypti]|uniref:Uncharacterized protein n=1 Tax=secondary endosymbiont of Ctenarytaina eucalypti TaxID=1199245 RepID=J3TFL9_9ENTR|nr:hypothetical protein A359_06720 [secondary endosymbiont of Ctenarytaina eucalypti]